MRHVILFLNRLVLIITQECLVPLNSSLQSTTHWVPVHQRTSPCSLCSPFLDQSNTITPLQVYERFLLQLHKQSPSPNIDHHRSHTPHSTSMKSSAPATSLLQSNSLLIHTDIHASTTRPQTCRVDPNFRCVYHTTHPKFIPSSTKS